MNKFIENVLKNIGLEKRDIVKQLIVDGQHMIDARKLRYDDLQYDTLHTILIMDGYDQKSVYKGKNHTRIYYEFENLIHYALEVYFRKITNNLEKRV